MHIYRLHIALPEAGPVSRTIEMRGDQTLEQLHLAIQAAFDWDAAHFYSFFLSGVPWDEESEYAPPEDAFANWDEDDDWEDDEEDWEGELLDLAGWAEMSPEERRATEEEFTQQTGLPGEVLHSILEDDWALGEADDEEEETDVGNVQETTLESLSLAEGQQFLYLFDYGDEHHFQIRVESISAYSDPDAAYPRLVAEEGDDPPQYFE